MRAIRFINVNHTIRQCKHLHWTKSNASSTAKAPIFVDDEFMQRNSCHDHWKDSWFMASSFFYGNENGFFWYELNSQAYTPLFPVEQNEVSVRELKNRE